MNTANNITKIVLNAIVMFFMLGLCVCFFFIGYDVSAGVDNIGAESQIIADQSKSTGEIEAVFETDSTKWSSQYYKFAAPRFVNNEYGKGYEFNCDFSLGDPKYPRCLWDAKLANPVNLSRAVTIAMKVRLLNFESVKSIAFYLKSNGKWYLSKYYDKLGEGMNSVVFQIEDYRPDGSANRCKPESLNRVDTIRLNVFNNAGNSTPAIVTISGVYVSPTKIESSGALPLFQTPKEDAGLKRTNHRDAAGNLLENRAILDMDAKFLKEGTDTVIDKIKRAGFNIYMPCVWHGRGALYRSNTTRIEPRFAGCFKGTSDPTAEMIRTAHAAGIQVHTMFTVAYRGEPDPHPEFTRDGLPIEGGYLTPYDMQDPAFRDFIVKEIISFASNYDIDGLNLDYIRTAGISYSKIARESYRKKYNADIDELKDKSYTEVEARFLKWQEEAVSDVVRRVSEGVRAVKPKIVISVCGHPLAKPQLEKQGRNEWLWLENKWIDIVYDMSYGWRPDFKKFEEAGKSTGFPGKCAVMLGNYDEDGRKGVSRNAEQVVRLVDYTLKKYPDCGVAIFDYLYLNDDQVKALRDGPFKESAVPCRTGR